MFARPRGIQAKFFTADQNFGKRLKYILTKFELFTSCRIQDIAVQKAQFFSYFCVAI